VFVGAKGQGIPAYAKKDALPLIPDGQDPIQRQGIISVGFAFRAVRRVDLGAEVMRGFGDGIAPWAVGVNFLVVSGGKEHEGRAVTPIGQLAADVTQEFVNWAVQKLQMIDPYLKKDCVLYDDNHKPMTKLGELSPDEQACIYQGLRVPIGPHFWKDPAERRVCYDKEAHDCFLIRSDQASPWEPIHPLLVQHDCFAYLNGQPWMRVGKLSADKKRCENQEQSVPVGQTLKPDHRLSDGWYCYDETNKENPHQKHHWCIERPERPISDGGYVGRHFVGRSEENLENIGKKTIQVATEMADGTPLHATTPVREAVAAGRRVIDAVKNAKSEDARRVYHAVLEAAEDWGHKPPREKAADVAQAGADIATDPLTYIPGVGALGKGGRLVVEGAEVTADAARMGRRAGKAAKAARAVDEARDAKAAVPLWSSTQRKSAVQNALGHWNKHKAEFPELTNSKQYVEAAHSLAANPPATALIKKRGADTLIYDTSTNTFLVKGADGAPRSMFRPVDGIDYFNKQ